MQHNTIPSKTAKDGHFTYEPVSRVLRSGQRCFHTVNLRSSLVCSWIHRPPQKTLYLIPQVLFLQGPGNYLEVAQEFQSH